MIRKVAAAAMVLALTLATVGVGLAAEKLVKYDSPRIPASEAGLRFTIKHPLGWSVAWGGDRTRFHPSDAEGPHLSLTFVHVEALPKDVVGTEALLAERDGIEAWVRATRPRFEVQDRRRVKVGSRGEQRDALLVKDPAQLGTPDRRELIVLVPIEDVLFLIRCSAPQKDFAARDPLFRAMLETFDATKPSGG